MERIIIALPHFFLITKTLQKTIMRENGQATWFEIKIKYDKIMEDGLQKSVTEPYVMDALTFTEAEENIISEMSAFISGEFEVKDIKKASFRGIFFSDDPKDDRWYKAKVQFIIIDEKSGKEKYSSVNYLVQGRSLQNAIKNVEEVMNGGLQDWKFASIAETPFMDVFEHNEARTKKEE